MNLRVRFQGVNLRERLVTDLTLVGLIPSVNPAVNYKILFHSEPSAAILANVRLLSAMQSHVSLQVKPRNHLGTDLAGSHVISSVLRHVHLQALLVKALKVTQFAFVLLPRLLIFMDTLVYPQVIQGAVARLANLTDKRSLFAVANNV